MSVIVAMAEKQAPNEEEPGEGASSPRESFLDQFLRRLDQTSDQEAGVSPSTTGGLHPEYASLTADNPWLISTPHGGPSSPLNPDLQAAALHSLLYPVAPPYSNPLAEFPWLLQEFDHPGHRGLDSRLAGGTTGTDSHDSAQRLYSSYSPQEQLIQGASSQLFRELPVKDEPGSSSGARNEPSVQGGHGGGSGSKILDAGPVPRFDSRTVSSEELRAAPSSGHNFSDIPGSAQTQIIGASSRQINHRPGAPTSPLLSDTTTAVGAGGSVTTSAGTSNASLSSESTSNAGDEDDGEKREVGETSSGKRKKPEAAAAAGRSGEEGTGRAGETPVSKKSDPPK